MTQPFAFLDVSSDFQGVTLQGQVTYRVAEPAKLAERLDFSVKPNGMYRTEDSLRMKERLVQSAQVSTRAVLQRMALRDVLIGSHRVPSAPVAAAARAHPPQQAPPPHPRTTL